METWAQRGDRWAPLIEGDQEMLAPLLEPWTDLAGLGYAHLDRTSQVHRYIKDSVDETLLAMAVAEDGIFGLLPEPVRVKGGKFEQREYLTFGADLPKRPGDYGLEIVHGMAWLVRAHEADETERKRKDAEVEIHLQRLMPADALRIRGRHNAVNALAALALANSAGCPLTVRVVISKPMKSRLKLLRFCFARASMIVFPSRSLVATSLTVKSRL